MQENKAITILGYILIFILLSPIIAIMLYLIIGGGLFYFLAIYNRVKNGKSDIKEGKEYKTISTILFLIAILVVFFIYSSNKIAFNIFTWRDFFVCQAIAFIGFIPLNIYYYKKIKEAKLKVLENQSKENNQKKVQ